jgi:Uma2 family endonuclease
MGQAMRKYLYDESEYLASESHSPVKREFVAGEVYAMAGATARHNRISGNLYVKLDAATRGTPCEVFMADMKVKVEAHRAFYYPDVLLACEPGDDEPLYRTSPCLIVEVLSPSTAGIDEREKWHHYRDIPTLRHYLLIDSESRQVRLRTWAGTDWLEQTLAEGDTLALSCGPVRLEMGLAEIYDRSGLEANTPLA